MKFLFADNGSWNTLSIHIKWRLKCCENEKHFMLKTWRPFYISIVWITRAIFKAGRLHFFPSHLCCCILFAFSNEISVHLICFWWKKRKTCFAALFCLGFLCLFFIFLYQTALFSGSCNPRRTESMYVPQVKLFVS